MSIQACRTCLAHDTLMYTITNSTLLGFYEKITNVTFNTENGRPSVMCYICYHTLKKCHRFTQSAIKADEVLQQICKSGMQITEQNISMIHKSLFCSYQRSPVTHFITPCEVPQNVEIKRENMKDEIKRERMDLSEGLEDINEEDVKHIVIKVETELDMKETEVTCSPEDTVHSQDLHHSSDLDDAELDDPLESISIKEEDGDVEEDSVSEMYEPEMRGAPEPEKRELERTTKSPEKQEIQSSSKEDRVAENSANNVTIMRGARRPKKRKLDKTTKSPEKPEVQSSSKGDIDAKNSMKNVTITIVNHAIAEHGNMDVGNKQSYLNKKQYCENNFVCKYCHHKSARKQDLVKHIRTHTNERPFTCNYCEKKFSHTSTLSKHLRTHTGEKPFTCNYCEKKFTDASNLAVHLRIHTGEKPFTCDHCGKKFIVNGHLLKHLRIHTGEKPYTCDYCEKKFTDNSNLSRHLRTHTGEKPYTCNYCDKSFTRTNNLSVHLMTHTD